MANAKVKNQKNQITVESAKATLTPAAGIIN